MPLTAAPAVIRELGGERRLGRMRSDQRSVSEPGPRRRFLARAAPRRPAGRCEAGPLPRRAEAPRAPPRAQGSRNPRRASLPEVNARPALRHRSGQNAAASVSASSARLDGGQWRSAPLPRGGVEAQCSSVIPVSIRTILKEHLTRVGPDPHRSGDSSDRVHDLVISGGTLVDGPGQNAPRRGTICHRTVTGGQGSSTSRAPPDDRRRRAWSSLGFVDPHALRTARSPGPDAHALVLARRPPW